MEYKGVVFLLGPPTAYGFNNLVRGSSLNNVFDRLYPIGAEDGIGITTKTYTGTSDTITIDYTPMVGERGKGKVLVCPVRAASHLIRDGNIRSRIRCAQDVERLVGLGFAGSYFPDARLGDVMLPLRADSSPNMIRMFQGDPAETEPGYSDEQIRKALLHNVTRNGFTAKEVDKTITVADIPEVTDQSPQFKRDRYLVGGYYGSDMETSWLLRRANLDGKRCGSALIVSDTVEDRPFENPDATVPYYSVYDAILGTLIHASADELLK